MHYGRDLWHPRSSPGRSSAVFLKHPSRSVCTRSFCPASSCGSSCLLIAPVCAEALEASDLGESPLWQEESNLDHALHYGSFL